MIKTFKTTLLILGFLALVIIIVTAIRLSSTTDDSVVNIESEKTVFLLGVGQSGKNIDIAEYSTNGNLVNRYSLDTEHRVGYETFGPGKSLAVEFDPLTGDVFYLRSAEYSDGEDWYCLETKSDGSCSPAALYKDNIFNPGADVLMYEPDAYNAAFSWTYDPVYKKIYVARRNGDVVDYYEIDVETLEQHLIVSLPAAEYNTMRGLSVENGKIVHPYFHYPNKVMKVNFVDIQNREELEAVYFDDSESFAQISSDFSKIALSDSVTSFKIIEADSRKIETIKTDEGSFVGNAIVFWSNRGQEVFLRTQKDTVDGKIFEIHRVNLNSGLQEKILSSTLDDHYRLLDVSPSGAYLLLKRITGDIEESYIFNTDDGSLVLLEGLYGEGESGREIRLIDSNVIWVQ